MWFFLQVLDSLNLKISKIYNVATNDTLEFTLGDFIPEYGSKLTVQLPENGGNRFLGLFCWIFGLTVGFLAVQLELSTKPARTPLDCSGSPPKRQLGRSYRWFSVNSSPPMPDPLFPVRILLESRLLTRQR